MTATIDPAESFLHGRHVAVVGRLGSLGKRDARKMIQELGGIVVSADCERLDLIVLGGGELPMDLENLFTPELRESADNGQIEILSEFEFWNRIGCVNGESQPLYTPAMLADLLSVSVSTIRSWYQRGLIVPVQTIHRLPYFDFQQVAAARHVVQMIAAGFRPAEIKRKLSSLVRYLPQAERHLAALAVVVDGKQLLLRQDGQLLEPNGQRRLDFDVGAESDDEVSELVSPASFSFPQQLSCAESPVSLDWLLQRAADHADRAEYTQAADSLRAALSAGGPNAEICFLLAEVLYRSGDLSAARERYLMALELDESMVEARSNLGCVLEELGDYELAIAAFRGALSFHDDYADVHYHLARSLDHVQRTTEAELHWREFLRLAPDSPWSHEARTRLTAGNQQQSIDDLESN